MYIVKTVCFKRDRETLRPTGNRVERSFEAETVREVMRLVKAAKENHDMTKETPLEIYDVINTEE